MKEFKVGNVIKMPNGQVEIIYDVNIDGYVHSIAFDSVNFTYTHPYKTETVPTIDGFAHFYQGVEDAVLLAPTVKDWIVQSLTKGFGF